MYIAPLPGPDGLYSVSVMPRFLLDSRRIGWQGAYFTDIHCAPDGTVEHGHERYCIQRGMHGETRRPLGSAGWHEFGAGFSVWRAGDEQRICWRGSGRSQFLFIAPEQVESMLGQTRMLPAMGHRQPLRSRVLELVFDALQSDLAQGSPAGPLVGDSLITALVAQLGGPEVVADRARPAPRACDRAIELIEARFAEPVTLRALADTAGLGARHFCRAFRHATGRSPHQYLLERRVEQAKLLIAKGLPLADVAVQCGFADQSQLTRTFARQVGTTPGRYRSSLLR
jgi:AraC family transcriptional regulator